MSRVISLRLGRWGLPLIVLAVSLSAAGACAWEAVAQQQALATLEMAIQKGPSRDAMIAALSQLLPLLQDDPPGAESTEQLASRAERERDLLVTELVTVRATITEQQQRVQEMPMQRRRRDLYDDTLILFSRLNQDLPFLDDNQRLVDLTPVPVDDVEETQTAAQTSPMRRTLALKALRDRVFAMMKRIRETRQTSTRLSELNLDAQERVATSWRIAISFGVGGIILAAFLHLLLEGALWRPLRLMNATLERIASRRYSEPIHPKGAPEMLRMFGSLAAICERGVCSEQDRAQEVADRSNQKVRSERLAGIGLLATGVAHEINNPLTAIVGAADGLNWRISDIASKLAPDDAAIVKEYLSMIVNEAKRCRSITTKLLDFARGRDGERALYDVTAIVNEVVGMFRHVRQYSSRTVELNRQDPVRAYCNGPEIKQVVLNLVANALQATPDGGRLDIRISSTPDVVEVVFQDTGSGMSPETLEHLFDPFFSTKGPGQGTGLGLSISHAIVEKHEGTLEAASAGPGQGSTFRLRLPATEMAAKSGLERKAA